MSGGGGALPVLMYHGIHSDAVTPDAAGQGHLHPVYSVRPADFARQLDWLVATGYRGARLADIDAAPRDKRVVITFDDGDVSNVDIALPMLVERGLVAEFFVVSDRVDEPGCVRSADLRALVASGMGVQSHGRTHRPLDDLPMPELAAELADSRAALASWSGAEVTALSLPGGRGRRRERDAALQLGYTHVLGSVPGPNRNWQPGRYLQRIAVTRDMPLPAFHALVEWSGARSRCAATRYRALELAKRTLGNDAYARLRSMLMAARGTPLPAQDAER